VGQLAIMFFIPGRMAQGRAGNDPIPPALRAFRRLSLRSSLLQARRAGGVRLCSQRNMSKPWGTIFICNASRPTCPSRE
jgi:hypothetical protein